MIRGRLLAAAAAVMLSAAATPALAGTQADAYYRLFWLSPGGPVRVFSFNSLPAGSNTPPNNQWRYDYEVLNKSVNAMNTFYAFFNSDNVNRASFVSGTAPANWTILQQGPVAPNFNFKVRYRTLSAPDEIPQGQKLLCSALFRWTGATVPGSQNYDMVNDGGSEPGVTQEIVDTSPALPSTWSKLRSLYAGASR